MPPCGPVSQSFPAVLPTRYYLDHFVEMLDFVVSKYDHALDESHRRFVDDFRRLDLDARCLYVRLTNRKGDVFRCEYLKYDEIASIPATLDRLRAAGFIRSPRKEDFTALLALKSRVDLVALIKEQTGDGTPAFARLSSIRKADLVAQADIHLEFRSCFPDNEGDGYFVQDRCEEIDFLLFLYFGKRQRGLTNFALRDIGLMRTAGFKTGFTARFESGDVARAAFQYSGILSRLERPDYNLISGLAEEAPSWPVIDDPEVDTARHRALYVLGRELERVAEIPVALGIYQLSDQFPSTERAVRLLLQLERREDAQALLLRLIENPSCDEELIFAEDFHERKFHRKKVGRLTAMLREAPVIGLDESGRERAETSAVRYYERAGAEAFHAENVVWIQLFGLLFWDLLFESDQAAFHNPFEFRPQDLNSGVFLQRNREAFTDRLALLDDPPLAIACLRDTWDRLVSTPNALVPWYEDVFTWVCRLVELAPRGGLAPVLEAMAENHRANRSGFPDLIVVEKGQLRFVEIKAEGDQIRRNQLVQIERLKRAGFDVEMVKVRWTVDPDQEYVVVDLETTGGNPSSNRITEIGAVKVRGGEIIGEWSTLVNPERSIPKFVVGLTGITDEMVSTAPRFPEIADSFREFLGEAVFVAHRAKFDHGFLKAEYERLGEAFQGPTMCTVVEMRRHFPGLGTYGLGSLCTHFGIALESHHRALCDARATAALLDKINAKRINPDPI
jgi:DNA polymerase III subunit epsilon